MLHSDTKKQGTSRLDPEVQPGQIMKRFLVTLARDRTEVVQGCLARVGLVLLLGLEQSRELQRVRWNNGWTTNGGGWSYPLGSRNRHPIP